MLPADVYDRIRAETVSRVRGTVQADILKEDQAQNTCIFSTEFALGMMGDIQQWFVDNDVRNFYSVSISGYHMAEAEANPITQLAFTLANGFTYVENYLARGMDIDDFAPNLSFFFSNGIDAEYAVIGRVARRIWAKAIKHRYGGNERSQKLKYHVQTSGRSLCPGDLLNDIRTTLQALYAIYDNTNSLHTNAYDEAITTPTEESVRRALAIQLIINQELGLAKNQNPLQELHHRADRSGRGGSACRVRPDQQPGECWERWSGNTSAPRSRRNPLLRAAEGGRRLPRRRGQHLHLKEGSPCRPRALIEVHRRGQGSPDRRPRLPGAESRDRPSSPRGAAESGDRRRQRVRPAHGDGQSGLLGQMSALYEVGGQYRRNM